MNPSILPSVFLSLLSGLIYVFSFAPWNFGFLQWFAFIPLFFAVSRLDAQAKNYSRFLFLIGFIMNFVICLGGFYWIAHSVEHYGEMPMPVAVSLLLVFCCFGQLQIPLFLVLRSKLEKLFPKHSSLHTLAGAVIYVGIESLMPKLFSDTAGNAFYKMIWTRQIVELGGPFLLTFCSIAVSEYLFEFFKTKKWRPLVASVLMILSIQIYGAIRVAQVQTQIVKAEQGSKLNISLIQGNIGDYIKIAAEKGSTSASREVIDQYVGLSTQSLQTKPDLIVWPETAYPALFGQSRNRVEHSMEYQVREFAKKYPGTLAFGGYDQDLQHLDYNSMYFLRNLAPEDAREIYHKAILLEFGETLPGADYFPSMKSLFPMMGFFGKGPGAQIFTVPNAGGTDFFVAPSICYEALFPSHSYDGSSMGSDFLLNITNDSWFGKQGEPYLHLALTTYRSIEVRQYLARGTNTGITAIIDPTGELIQQTALFTPAVLSAAIPKRLEIFRFPQLLSLFFIRFTQLGMLIILGLAIKKRD